MTSSVYKYLRGIPTSYLELHISCFLMFFHSSQKMAQKSIICAMVVFLLLTVVFSPRPVCEGARLTRGINYIRFFFLFFFNFSLFVESSILIVFAEFGKGNGGGIYCPTSTVCCTGTLRGRSCKCCDTNTAVTTGGQKSKNP